MKRGALTAWLSILSMLPLLAFVAVAHAQTVAVHDQVSTGTGVSDNPGFLSDQRRAEADAPGGDLFVSAANVLTLGLARAESTHSLAYDFGITRYVRQAGESFMNHAAVWTSLFQLSQRLALTLTAGARYRASNAAQLEAEPSARAFEARPTGNYRLFSLTAGQALVWNISNQWAVNQGLAVAMPIPVGDSPVLENGIAGTIDIGVVRTWTVTAVRGSLTVGGARPFASDDSMQAPQEPVARLPHFVEPLVGLNYAFTPELSADGAGGAVFSRGGLAEPWRFGPAGSLGLRWSRLPQSATISAYRSASTSLWFPTIIVSTGVRGALGYQVGERQPLHLSAFGSYSVGRMVALSTEAESRARYYVAGLVAAFSPVRRYDVRIVAGYSFSLQRTTGMGDAMAFGDVRQSVISLGVSAGFPADAPPLTPTGGAAP